MELGFGLGLANPSPSPSPNPNGPPQNQPSTRCIASASTRFEIGMPRPSRHHWLPFSARHAWRHAVIALLHSALPVLGVLCPQLVGGRARARARVRAAARVRARVRAKS